VDKEKTSRYHRYIYYETSPKRRYRDIMMIYSSIPSNNGNIVIIVRHAGGSLYSRRSVCSIEHRNVIVVVRHTGVGLRLDCRFGSEPRCVPPESLLGEQWNVVVLVECRHPMQQIVSGPFQIEQCENMQYEFLP
jgi:hypothetical protein